MDGYYLAYGSNMGLELMRARCPSAAAVAGALLADARLAYADWPGSGWAHGAQSVLLSAPGSCAAAVLYTVERGEMAALEQWEGVTSGLYALREGFCEYAGRPCCTYLARPGVEASVSERYAGLMRSAIADWKALLDARDLPLLRIRAAL